MRLTGPGSPRQAYAAIKAAKDRGWESYRSIERFSADGETCRRRQILDHFGDDAGGRAERPLLRRVRPGRELERARRARRRRRVAPRGARHWRARREQRARRQSLASRSTSASSSG